MPSSPRLNTGKIVRESCFTWDNAGWKFSGKIPATTPYLLDNKGVWKFLHNMSLEVQRKLLQGHINRMYDEGDVDHQFDRFQVYRNVEKADELLKQVELYCLEANQDISRLESYSKLPKINFLEATKIARSIKARSTWIGAQNVRKASFFVIDACLGFHEESYSQAVDGLRNDFKHTKERFETYLEMVRKVIEKENKEKQHNH